MTTRRLGHTDMELSPIGLGSWQFSQGKGYTGGMWAVLEQPMIDAVVAAALAGGIDWIDSAEAYGNGQSERAVSTALHHLRVHPSGVTLATKWLPIPRTAANIPRTIDTRLRCLQGYPIGLYQVHFPGSVSSIRAQMGEMAKLVRAGRVGSVGVSNFSARRMEEASAALRAEGLSLASNQVPISLLDRRIESDGVLESARRLGVTLIAYSPLAQGLLAGKLHESAELVAALPPRRRSRLTPAGRAFRDENLARTLPLVEELRSIGMARGVSATQVALAWVITFYGETVVAIPGATSPDHARENAAAMKLSLTKAELSRLERASALVARR